MSLKANPWIFFVLFVTSNAWALTAEQEAVYQKSHPYYAEPCGLTEIHRKGTPGGNPAGHAVMYLKGACLDREAAIPALKLCPEGAGTGAGISADSVFRNVNWAAVEGESLFKRGDVADDEGVFEETLSQVRDRVKASGAFTGLESKMPEAQAEPDPARRLDLITSDAIGTNVAVNLARTSWCTRVPMSRAMMSDLIAYLNQVNRETAASSKGYVWDAILNNCVHILHNALAAAGVWPHRLTQDGSTNKLIHAFQVIGQAAALAAAIPKNEFINTATQSNEDGKIGGTWDVYRIFQDGHLRKYFMKYGWLPMQPGGITTVTPAHALQNEVFDLDLNAIALQYPFAWNMNKAFERVTTEPRYIDYAANLEHFKKLYERSLARRHDLGWYRNRDDGTGQTRTKEFAAFYPKYFDYIQAQLDFVNAELARL